MVSKPPQWIMMTLQLLIESFLLAIFVTNSENVLGGHYVGLDAIQYHDFMSFRYLKSIMIQNNKDL